ncbi:MAG TPA: hypothetical protein VNQ55_10315, partial [Parapedobacter sp.]|nr:hypothetical protein [Parapedobacter sp.]
MHFSRYIPVVGMLLLSLLCGGCGQSQPPVAASYYYWKTVYNPDSTERSAIRNAGANRIFVRIMDVDNQGPNGEAIPVSAVSFKEPLPDTLAVVPVVYIVNNVLKEVPSNKLDALATNICRFVSGKLKQAGKQG